MTEEYIDKNVKAVVDKFRDRMNFGYQKYNTTTERTDIDLIGWIVHCQEELMDSLIYLERIKEELKNEQ